MAHVFLSHASDDRDLAVEIYRWLVDAGHDVFLAVDRHVGIRVGEMWEQALYAHLREADAVVCVVSSWYVASRWCAIEIAGAKMLGTRLVPVSVQRGCVIRCWTRCSTRTTRPTRAAPSPRWMRRCGAWRPRNPLLLPRSWGRLPTRGAAVTPTERSPTLFPRPAAYGDTQGARPLRELP